MKLSKDQQSEQLDYLHQLYRDNLKMRATIKNWCIIIWSGIIIIILTQRNDLLKETPRPIISLIVLLFFPIMFFWLLEAIEGARTRLYRDMLVKLEINCPFFIINSYQNITICQKIRYFLGAFFCSETLLSFYIPLGLVSALLVLAIKIWC